MSNYSVDDFLDRLEADPELAARLGAVKPDPDAVQALMSAEGYDLSPTDVRNGWLERLSGELGEEQRAEIAGGISQSSAGALAAYNTYGSGHGGSSGGGISTAAAAAADAAVCGASQT